MSIILYKDTNQRLGLIDTVDIDGTPVTDAVVTTTLYNASNTEVAGQLWPATLVHDVDGNYYVTLDSDLEIDVGRKYYFLTVAVSGPIQKTWKTEAICEYAS